MCGYFPSSKKIRGSFGQFSIDIGKEIYDITTSQRIIQKKNMKSEIINVIISDVPIIGNID